MAKVKMNITSGEIIRGLRLKPKTLLELAQFWLKRIQGFTRTGFSLVTNDELLSLSPAYRKLRAASFDPKGVAFKPNKSNLTFTGQLLRSLRGTANANTQNVRVAATGNRDNGLTNEKLAGDVAERGRPFLGLDDKGLERMNQIVLRDLRRQLKKRPK